MDQDKAEKQERHLKMKKRLWLWSIWSWPVGGVGAGIGLVVAGLIPPPSPSLSAQEIMDMFTGDTTRIRLGVMFFLYFSAMLLPFYTVISAEIKKIEGKNGLLAPIQFGGAVVLITFFQILGLAWLLASYRLDVGSDISRMLNDYSFFVWSMLIPTYIFQYLCMAFAGFMDTRDHPIWPRWAAYMNVWVAFMGAGGFLAVFFKAGPFAWNGIIGFYIPAIIFAVGNFVTTYLLLRRYKYEEANGLFNE